VPQYELQPAPQGEPVPQGERTDASVITAARAVLDQFHAKMREFESLDITEILMSLAAFSAWASELRGQCQRYDTRRLQSFRTRELDPFLEELDRQFKVWSRYQAVRELEFRLSGGGI
jgi:hypothetical protein